MLTFLVVMSFMQGYMRNDWMAPAMVQEVPSLTACQEIGRSIVKMEPRTRFECIQVPSIPK